METRIEGMGPDARSGPERIYTERTSGILNREAGKAITDTTTALALDKKKHLHRTLHMGVVNNGVPVDFLLGRAHVPHLQGVVDDRSEFRLARL